MERKKLRAAVGKAIREKVPLSISATLILRAFGWWNVPLLFSVRPTVTELSDSKAVVRIPLRRWTRNHWGTMYFGTLAIGADCVVALVVMHHLWKMGAKDVSLVFKDFQANFLRRPDGHVLFVCEEGKAAKELAAQAAGSSERVHRTLRARAVLEGNPSETVAEFTLTVSLKRKG